MKIAINTGGGDAPGLNAVIRAATRSAIKRGWKVFGIQQGYDGLLGKAEIVELTRDNVRGIAHLGGTILGSTNQGDPFQYPVKNVDGTITATDLSGQLVDAFNQHRFDVLITCGGDGSMRIAHKLTQMGMNIVGVPKTIDNDLSGTVVTFGFDTALNTATDAIDKLHPTAQAHRRVMVLEVMGRYAGWIALNAGVSATADVVLIPEIPFDMDKVCAKVMERESRGRKFSIVVVAEGARPNNGDLLVQESAGVGKVERLGGIGHQVAQLINEKTGKDCRTVVLGHLQRGGSPSTFDRLIAQRFGAAAVRLIEKGNLNQMVVLDPPHIKSIPLADAVNRTKFVPLDCDTILTARDLGICLGD